ncbi:MAG: hypothetical protein ATN36_04435 [Epulopiscium sp. Nele67-Bin005]|nr:MAG: hypothetical protein ATN36_04435 [Epulopiscium sp. Nele67-Bin005]
MERFNNLKLARKLTIIIVLITALINGILLTVTVTNVTKNNEELIMDKFTLQAELNATIIQNLVTSGFNIATDLQAYIENSYANFTAPPVDEEGNSTATNTGIVYGGPIATGNSRMEDYLLNTAWSAITDNEDVSGIGLFFDKYAFDPTQEIYAFWVSEFNAQNQSFLPVYSYSEYSNEEFFTAPKSTHTPYITTPAQNINGDYTCYVSYPIIYQGEFKATLCVELMVSNFERTAISNPKYPTLYSSILNSDWVILYDSTDLAHIGHNVGEYLTPQCVETWTELAAKEEFFITEAIYPNNVRHLRFASPIQAGNEIWWSHIEISPDNLYSDVVEMTVVIVTLSLVALVALIVLVTGFINKMLKPLDAVVDASSSIENGNLTISLEARYTDEVGILSNSFMDMASHLKSIVSEIEFVLGEMARGDFTAISKMKANYNGQFSPIKKSLYDISKTLSLSLENINKAATEVNHGADEIAVGASEIAQGTIAQGMIIDTFVMTTGKIEKAVNDAICQIEETGKISLEAKQKATEGVNSMSKMLTSMNLINESSQTISEVLKTVEDIAEQTNLLALNASIEAARAGEAGQGFAIVATEIRELATRSSDCVQQIESVIKESTSNVEKGQEMANATAKSLNQIVDTIEKTADIAHTLLQTSEAQQHSIDELIEGTSQIENVVKSNNATSQESAAISEELASQAQALENLLQHFTFTH